MENSHNLGLNPRTGALHLYLRNIVQNVGILSYGTSAMPSSITNKIKNTVNKPAPDKKCQISCLSNILIRHSSFFALDWAGVNEVSFAFWTNK